MAEKEDIRPIYSELQGYLSQAPNGKIELITYTKGKGLWEQVNETIDELSKITGNDYSRFKMIPRTSEVNSDNFYIVHAAEYRTKLGGIISRLHGEYFSNEPAPFSGMPSTVIRQNQHQSQSIQVQMLIDFQSKIDEEIQKLEPGDKKRSFLEKIKGSLASVKDYAGLIALYITTAQEFGLSIKELLEVFKY
jgi:hypothetical protein